MELRSIFKGGNLELQKRERMNRAAALRLGGLSATAAVCSSFFPSRARAQGTLAPVSLLSVPNDSSGEMYYAQELGLFAKAGLDVRLQSVNDPSATAGAVLSGTATFGGLTIPGYATAHQRGIPIVIVAPTSIYSSANPTSGIIVLKNSSFKRASDLNGKTIATRDIFDMSYYGAKVWIDKNGGDSKTIKWFEIGDTTAVAAMQAGRIDAAAVSEPALDNALHGPDARLLAACDDAIADRFLIAAHYTTVAYAKANPEIVQGFCDAIISAGIWANNHHAESAKILEKYLATPVPPTNRRVTYAERVRPGDAQPVLDVLLQYGVLKAPLQASVLFAPELHIDA